MTSPPGGSRLGRAMGSGRAPVPGGAVGWRRRYGSGAETVPLAGRPWCLPLADRVLLVAVHYRTNLTTRQLPPLFAISPTTVCRVIHRLRPLLAIVPAPRPVADVERLWIVDGTLVSVHTVRRPHPPATTGSRPTGAPEDDDGLTAEDRLTSARAESTCPG